MTDKINDGGPAFPFAAEYGHPAACGGMSLRDWFASQVPVTLEDASIACGWGDLKNSRSDIDSNRATLLSVMACLRYEYADAMLAAREGGAS